MSPIPVLLLATILPAAKPVKVQFTVYAPKNTPPNAKVYLAGNTPALGSWRANGRELQRQDDDSFTTEFEAAEGEKLEFKFTLGTWESVEKDANGNDIRNRTRTVSASKNADAMVAALDSLYIVDRWASTDAKSTTPSPNPPERKSTRTGDIRLHENFESRELANKRSLIVYLPPGYEDPANKDERYPVLYMHDGQNLFDAATSFIGVEWQADETAERLIKAKKIPPIIIVGIYNTPDRMNEYTPTRDEKRNAGGKGDMYASFVVNMVKPFIDKTYRTSPKRRDTAVAGSSLGGIISLHMAVRYPHLFSQVGVISPALFWDDCELVRRIEAQPILLGPGGYGLPRIWLDMGTKEGDSLPTFEAALKDTRRLAAALVHDGLREEKELMYTEVEGALHNEGAWAVRLENILVFFSNAKGDTLWNLQNRTKSKSPNSKWFENVDPATAEDFVDYNYVYRNGVFPPLTREDALAVLLGIRVFRSPKGVVFGDVQDIELRAFRVLSEQPDAAEVFGEVLKRADKAGQLYALCGLWRKDRVRFDSVVVKYLSDNSQVAFQLGGLTGFRGLNQIVESKKPCAVRLSPGQSIDEWEIQSKCTSSELDIVGGGYTWALLYMGLEEPTAKGVPHDILVP